MQKRIAKNRKVTSSFSTRCALSLFVSLLIACATGCVRSAPFPRTFVGKSKPGPKEVLRIVQRVELRKDKPILVGITEKPTQLFAWDFKKGLLWKRAVTAVSAPVIAGSFVVTHEADGIVGRALSSGEQRFVIDEDGELVGADGNRKFVAVTLAVKNEDRYRGLLVGVRNGKIEWERELELPGGVPAVTDDYIVLPWGTHRVSVIDMEEGSEYARWTMKDSVVGHAFVDRGFVYVGQHGIFRISKGFDAGRKNKGIYYSPLARSLPGQPELLRPSYEPIPPPDNAQHRVNLDWRASGEGDKIFLEDKILYMHFYRYIFALDADNDSILWIYQGPEDVVGTAVRAGGVLVADTAGKLRFLSAMGNPVWESQLKIQPKVVSVRLGDWAPPEQKASAQPAEGDVAESDAIEQPSLQEQLIVAAKLDDSRLAGARTFAIEHLARFDNAEVTASLLQICDDPGAPEPVRLAACTNLSVQSKGQQIILEALKRHASFIRDVPPPPVEALARTSIQMKLRNATPLLVSHLQDPQTPAKALPAVFEAIESLGSKSQVAPIERFLRLHHAEPAEEHLKEGLEAGMKALLALGGDSAKSTLQSIAKDPMSMPGLGKCADKILTDADAPAQKDKGATTPAQKKKSGKAPAAKNETEAPRYLSMGMVAQVLRPAEHKIRACMLKAAEKPLSARISMVVAGDGEIENIFVAPNSMQSCVEPIIREYRFVSTQTGRQQVAHVVRRIGPAAKGSSSRPEPKRKSPRKAPLRPVKK